MEAIAAVLEQLIRVTAHQARPEAARLAWQLAAGRALATRLPVERLEADCLYLRAGDPAWQMELAAMAPVVLARLNRLLGDPPVRRLCFEASAEPR